LLPRPNPRSKPTKTTNPSAKTTNPSAKADLRRLING
jgi:hypothetical protein